MTRKIRKVGKDRENLRLKKIYTDTNCIHCGRPEDTKHIIAACSEYEPLLRKLDEEVDGILQRYKIPPGDACRWHRIRNRNFRNSAEFEQEEKTNIAGIYGFLPKYTFNHVKEYAEKEEEITEICIKLLHTQIKFFRKIYRTRCKNFFHELKKTIDKSTLARTRYK